MKTIKKTFILLSTLVVLSSTLVACNTVHGFGKDVQATGQAISDTASH